MNKDILIKMCLVNISIAKGVSPAEVVHHKYKVAELLDMMDSIEVHRRLDSDIDVKAQTKVGIVPLSTLQMMAVTELVLFGGNSTYNAVMDVVNRTYELFEL